MPTQPPSNVTLIIGLGKSGLSCARYLAKQQVPFALVDSRESLSNLAEIQALYPKVPIYLGEFNPAIFLHAKELVVSPGISLQTPAISQAMAAGVSVLGDIELFARAVRALIIGITGTNAKGTVTTLVGDMIQAAGLKALVGGNIGIPALDLLTEPVPDYYVLELSSFQLETTNSLQLTAATILNISADHLDRHLTLQNYIAAKQRIYQHCQTAIYNSEDVNTLPTVPVPQKLGFTLSEPAGNEFGLKQINKEFWLSFAGQPLLAVNELHIKGKHNWANALAALALGHAIRLPMSAMLQALRAFKGLAHRCEWVLSHNNVAWYNDSKGTNVGSTLAAINGLGSTLTGKLILIAGGLGKGADFMPLREPIRQFARAVILLGQDAPLIANVIDNIVPVIHVKTLPEAVLYARQLGQPGDAVLLSPACASWDMFRDYEERGEVFKAAVKGLY